ncbi:MAG TPA: HBL/NHE enterotoxin family protein, partial [Pyrinomonadaceae bacterium]|nr:HBL/NHE enterotoxin family protein [Pyrinomonadaceae bacterium]
MLNFPPSWYADFTEKLAVAKADSLSWIYSVVPTLQLLPGSFINFNSVFQQNLSSLVQNLQAVKADPNDSTARQQLASVLQTLLTEVQSAQTVIQSLDSAMNTFAADLQPDAQTLGDLASSATTAAGADSAQVQKLDTVIENFRQAIASENQRASLENLLK